MYQVEMLKSKVHGAIITKADVNYVGSLTLDEDLMDAAGMLPFEKITVVNNNNGERIETYLIKGDRGTGVCQLNGAAARKGLPGDKIIIMAFASMDNVDAKGWKPLRVIIGDENKIAAIET